MAEAALKRPRRSLADFWQSPWQLGCAIAAALVLVYFAWFGLRFTNETQRELRRLPQQQAFDQRYDFNVFYGAAEMILHGDINTVYPEPGYITIRPGNPLYAFVPTEYAKIQLVVWGNYLNPLAYALLLVPIASLSFAAAFWIFTALSGAALLAFLFLSWRAGRGIPELPLFVLGVLCFKPVHEALILSQSPLFFMLALTGGYLLLRAERQVLAGLVFSSLALKPQWAVLPAAFLLVRGEWRALATMAAGSAAIVIVPFFFTSFHTVENYYHLLRSAPGEDLANSPHMFNWNGFLYKLRGSSPGDAPSPGWTYALIALTALPLALVWAGRDYLLGIAATIVAMLLMSTHSVWYDWSLLVVAGLFLLLSTRERGRLYRVQVWVVLIAIHLAAIQSVAVLLRPDRHNVDWYGSGFYSLTLVAFAALVWLAAVTLREGLIPPPSSWKLSPPWLRRIAGP